MDNFEDSLQADSPDEALSFEDRSELLLYVREFGDPVMTSQADHMAMELHEDMAGVSTRLATAMYRSGEIEPAEFNATIEAINGQMTLDQATQWAEELEAEIRQRQLTGELADDEDLDEQLADALRVPELTVEETIAANIRALHEQADVLGLSQDEIEAAELEIRRDAIELFAEESDDETDEGDPPLRWAA